VSKGERANVLDAVLDHPVAFKIGAGLDEVTQFLLQFRRQQGGPAGTPPIPQAIDAPGIVPHDPVPQGLPIHPGVTGRLSPADAVQSHRKGQKTAGNPRITFFASQIPKVGGAQVLADR
jgi:hypothetical protein